MIVSGNLSLDPAAHAASSARLSARLSDVDDRRRAAERTVSALLESWRGQAATRFQAGWQEWDSSASDVIDALSALLAAIDLARHDLVGADDHGAGRATDLSGRLG